MSEENEKVLSLQEEDALKKKPTLTYNGEMKGTIPDKYGDIYGISVSFDTQDMLPNEYASKYGYIDYTVTITSPVKENETPQVNSYVKNLPSRTLTELKWTNLIELVELQRKVDRIGDARHGITSVEIQIDFQKHYEDMVVNMVNSFVNQFDELPIEMKKSALNEALEKNKDKSITELVGTIFENTTDIKNFLAIDNTGELKKQLEQALNDAVQKGRIKMDVFSVIEKEMDYDDR